MDRTPTSPAQQQNLRGKPHHLYDCAGLVTNATFDFKGNLLASNRRLAVDYQNEPDWLVTDSASPATPSAILTAVETAGLLEDEAFDTATTYDALNRVTTLTTDDNSVTVPTYNIAGLLEQVRVGVRGATPRLVVRDIDYNARGQRTLCEYTNPETEALTTSIAYTYDAETFRLTTLVTTRGGTELQHLVYTYDPVGNIVALRSSADTPYFTGTPLVSGDGFYAYDPIYRLTEARGREHPGQTGISTQPGPVELAPSSVPHANDLQALIKYTETYLYDEVGNIERIQHTTQNFDNTQGPAWTQWTRRYQNATNSNRLLATSDAGDPDGTYSVPYDYSTNASNDGGLHGSITRMPHLPGGMFWDYADRLQRADRGGGGIVHFTYDAAGQRVRKVLVLPGTIRERIYLGGYELYRERPNTPNAPHDFERQTLHVMDDQRRVAMVETRTREAGTDIAAPVNLWRFQLDNHLGSSMVELDHAGAVISYEEYHPYGSTAFHAASTGSGVSAKRYRYTSKERDEETGFYYHGARYYAPWLGRWTAADPLGMARPGRVDLALYSYARGRPISRRDATGRDDEEPTSTANGGLGRFVGISRDPEDDTTIVSFFDGGTQFDVDTGSITFAPDKLTATPSEQTEANKPESVPSADTSFDPFNDLADKNPEAFGLGGEKSEDAQDVSASEVLNTVQGVLDVTSLALDATGVGGVLGFIPDLINAGISLGRGDYAGAGLSAVAAVPFVGSAANAARLTRAAAKGGGAAARTAKVVKGGGGAGRTFFHGTDIGSARSILGGAPLDAAKAASKKVDGPPGFFLATDEVAAEFFALRRGDGGILRFDLSERAVRELEAAGARLGPIPKGKFPGKLPGDEFVVPPEAFELFNLLRAQGEITVLGRVSK